MTEDKLVEFIAALKANGVLEDVAECVRRTRRQPGFWRLMRDDLEESGRRKAAGCARYELHHDHEGMVGRANSLGVTREAPKVVPVRGAA